MIHIKIIYYGSVFNTLRFPSRNPRGHDNLWSIHVLGRATSQKQKCETTLVFPVPRTCPVPSPLWPSSLEEPPTWTPSFFASMYCSWDGHYSSPIFREAEPCSPCPQVEPYLFCFTRQTCILYASRCRTLSLTIHGPDPYSTLLALSYFSCPWCLFASSRCLTPRGHDSLLEAVFRSGHPLSWPSLMPSFAG